MNRPPNLVYSLRCPWCREPVSVVGTNGARWYACKHHGAVNPVPFTSVGLPPVAAGGIFPRVGEGVRVVCKKGKNGG